MVVPAILDLSLYFSRRLENEGYERSDCCNFLGIDTSVTIAAKTAMADNDIPVRRNSDNAIPCSGLKE